MQPLIPCEESSEMTTGSELLFHACVHSLTTVRCDGGANAAPGREEEGVGLSGVQWCTVHHITICSYVAPTSQLSICQTAGYCGVAGMKMYMFTLCTYAGYLTY